MIESGRLRTRGVRGLCRIVLEHPIIHIPPDPPGKACVEVRIERLSRTYPNVVHALRDVSLTIVPDKTMPLIITVTPSCTWRVLTRVIINSLNSKSGSFQKPLSE